ncbi:NGG1p interacting factor 3 protein, NIF3 [Desulfurobacterium thermolithotrophum DSM 11699]|uniref:GTP cyclohydrolase 1 type 2 homolog n=1 Tax=Desulfurobacterium thermolithotrophum (strain DSM 11699 / BSA) TaxID=868864 RepID=F0S1X0_DESTD|nr:Nif3-like dinuclear metal center hexameric protein [Desulfurobacterium thermolithotrophum]ADY74051.1 NGG1p interacting factor 3 protein, NIF3 [Desulfurobacterium thermolithotrophum DSM 11699]
MVKLRDIIAFLEELVPSELQDKWDNSGLQIGWESQEVEHIGFALSVSKKILEQAKRLKVDLIITHHPITISGIKSFVNYSYPSHLFLELARNGIAVYSLHTNLDVSSLGPTAIIAEKLEVQKEATIADNPPYGIIGTLNTALTQKELFKKLTSFLPKDIFRGINYRPDSAVKRIAVCSGSGASFIDIVAKKVDVYITGDIKYHDALKAQDLGLTVFDMGHYGTERLFFEKLFYLLTQRFNTLKLTIFEEKSPYEVMRSC